MNTLVELNTNEHRHLKIDKAQLANHAASLHMLHLRVSEVPKAALTFPVFLSKASYDGRFSLSALSSFVAGSNVFVKDGTWDALYQPLSLRTFPFFLMQSQSGEQSYTVGILENNPVFSKEQGEPLFDDKGQPTALLSEARKVLESTIKEDILSSRFIQKLEELKLLKEIDLMLQHPGQKIQAVKGLFTINEDVLQGLSGAQLEELNKLGYLIPIHAMLMSLYQLNGVLLRNNATSNLQRVEHVRLEVARDRAVM